MAHSHSSGRRQASNNPERPATIIVPKVTLRDMATSTSSAV
jgi:hypothetical protein